jgi:uncharacterized membrane protein YfcA
VTGWDVVLVAAAGAACGVINSIAGGGSLILFPVLLLTGLKPLDANVTNSVSTWPGYVGGVGGFRAEIRERRHRLPRLLVATVAGSGTGCVLLLATPSSAFDVIIPWLVLAATVLTALQPAVRRRLREQTAAGGQAGSSALVMIFLAAIYGGYFGGALGVIVLAVLGLTIHDTLRHLNATKSVISLVDASISVVVFGLFGPVHWTYVAVAAPTTLVGGYLGAAIARRLDERVLRACVVVFGLAATVYLFVRS